MWLEALLGMSIALPVGLAVALPIVAPIETRRLLRLVKVEVGARLGIKGKRPSIQLALAADLDVDMKWWDEEFAKLKREIPTSNWNHMVQGEISKMTNVLAGEIARIEAQKQQKAGIKSVADGNVTYNVPQAVSMMHSSGFLSKNEAILKLEQEVTAREEGVRLGSARTKAVAAYVGASGTRNLDDELYYYLLRALECAANWGQLEKAKKEIRVATREQKKRDQECSDCEYTEHATYTSVVTIRHRTRLCWKCEQEKLDMGKRGYALAN